MAEVNNKYSFKDAYRLLRAIATRAEKIADSKEQMIIAQLEKSEEEQAEVDRLQAEISILKAKIDKLGTSKVVKESYKSLVYHKTTDAEEEANRLLKDLINSLGNATFIRAANSVPSKNK